MLPLTAWLIITLGVLQLVASTAQDERPHIVFFLADDYGWANLGVHRNDTGDSAQGLAEAHTPTLDKLAADGILLDRHYTFKYCAPSRSALQSGRLPVHVNMVNTGPLVHNPADPVSGFAGIPRNMTGIATKLRAAGYRTHAIGKWDAGMATPDHTPLGRGYESWLGYFQHANDYWNEGTVLQATGEIDQCLDQIRDFTLLNATYHGGFRDAMSMTAACRRNHEADPGCYEEQAFRERALDIISGHDTTERLFLFYAFHLVHTPLEVPMAYLQKIDGIVHDAGGVPFDSRQRRLYSAMVLFMDETVAAIVAALKDKHMWDRTLLIFASDNGGPVYEPGAANNHPLRGGKFSDFEGGIRGNAFVSGGFVPGDRRGTRFKGIVSIADWYATFSEIAGVDATDTRAAEANKWLQRHNLPTLPAIDSIAQWGHILNGSNGRTGALHISENTVLRWPYKLVTGAMPYGTWQGPVYPNCSTIKAVERGDGPSPSGVKLFDEHLNIARSQAELDHEHWIHDCDEGCLFDLEQDPNEHHDLANSAAHRELLQELQDELRHLNAGIFRPERGNGTTAACLQGLRNGGFLGPFVDAEGWYSEVPRPSLPKRIKDKALGAVFDIVGSPLVKDAVEDLGKFLGPAMYKVVGQGLDRCLVDTDSETGSVIV